MDEFYFNLILSTANIIFYINNNAIKIFFKTILKSFLNIKDFITFIKFHFIM
jgi:hypothetical protein